MCFFCYLDSPLLVHVDGLTADVGFVNFDFWPPSGLPSLVGAPNPPCLSLRALRSRCNMNHAVFCVTPRAR